LGNVNEKSPGSAPPRAALAVRTSGRVPVFVNVANCGALVTPGTVLGNVTVAGAAVAVVGANPVPINVTVCGTPRAPGVELVMITEAVRIPAAEGVKLMVSPQELPAAMTPEQLSTGAKSPGAGLLPAPCTASAIARGAFPKFWRLMKPVFVPPTGSEPTLSEAGTIGARVAWALSAEPKSSICCTAAGSLSVMVTVPERNPGVVAVSTTLSRQLASGASVAPQEPLREKPALDGNCAKLNVIPVNVVAALELVTDTVPAVLTPTIAGGELNEQKTEIGVPPLKQFAVLAAKVIIVAVAVPERVTVAVLVVKFPETANWPLTAPTVVGLNTTATVQLVPAATVTLAEVLTLPGQVPPLAVENSPYTGELELRKTKAFTVTVPVLVRVMN
jgi:hypothetical protein